MHVIAEEYKDGATFRELMKKYNKGQSTVRKTIIENGVRIRPSTEQRTDRHSDNLSTEEQINSLIGDYRSGLGFRHLIPEYRSSHKRIRRILNSSRARIVKSTHNIHNQANSDHGDKIAELYRKGASCLKLSKRFDIGRTTVNKIVKKHNIRIRTRPIIIDFPMIDIVRNYQSGMSLDKLAKKYKRAKKTLKNILVEAKVYKS